MDKAKGTVGEVPACSLPLFIILGNPYKVLSSLKSPKPLGNRAKNLRMFSFDLDVVSLNYPTELLKRFGHALFDEFEPLGTDGSHNDVSPTITGQFLFPRIH